MIDDKKCLYITPRSAFSIFIYAVADCAREKDEICAHSFRNYAYQDVFAHSCIVPG